VHRRGIDLDLAVLRIHTIDIFRIEKHSRILTLDIYIKHNTSVYKGI
jgi:predicted SnoaL-like aldol condensation-catalyzing enzyme